MATSSEPKPLDCFPSEEDLPSHPRRPDSVVDSVASAEVPTPEESALQLFPVESAPGPPVRDAAPPMASTETKTTHPPLFHSLEGADPPRRWHRTIGAVAFVGLMVASTWTIGWLAREPPPTGGDATRNPALYRNVAGDPVPSPSQESPLEQNRPLRTSAQPNAAVGSTPTIGSDWSVLSVDDFGTGRDVVERQLVGRSSRFAAGSEVVFWTRVVGGSAGDEIRHVWRRDGTVVNRTTLPVGGPHWRTYSRQRLEPDVEADWVVEAHNDDGRILARQEFSSVLRAQPQEP